jgi:HlyD family secretion protein
LRTRAQRRQDAITQLRDLGFRQLEIEQRLAAIHAQQSRLTITAPIDGTIHALAPLSQGGVLRASEPILTLIPSGLPMTLTAQIQAADIPHIHRDQTVRIRLTTIHNAFVLTGKVAMISGDRYRTEISRDRYRSDAGNNIPGTYQVRIRLTQDTLTQDLRDTLIVGLPAEAHFKTHSRSPISYLTHPFGDLLARALRTP